MNINISKLKVRQMESPRSYRPVANQFIIETEDGEYFQSYRTIIAFRPNNGRTVLDTDSWDYSVTTLKYLKEFLGTRDSKKDIEKRIKEGTYETTSLN